MSAHPEVSVVIPCHDERRWPQLLAAVASARGQVPAPAEIVVSVDGNESLLARATAQLTGVTVLANRFARGASGNRNTAVWHTRTPLVAMLDDDARARPGWLAALVAPFVDPSVVGTGGRTLPAWESGQPGWFPDEFLWVVGASFAGGPDRAGPVRNVWSLNMAVRREEFDAVGGFRETFGKVGARSQPEDTELCLRMAGATGGHWRYAPDAVVEHAVSRDRARFRYFLSRSWSEGRGKVALARLTDGRDRLGSEQDYLRRTLPRAVLRELAAGARGRGGAHLARAGATAAGMVTAGLGGMVELVRPGRRPAQPPAPPGPPSGSAPTSATTRDEPVRPAPHRG